MAKVSQAAPDYLTMRLFAPGMSALHRAGLGGLACTLKAMKREIENGSLPKSRLLGPSADGSPPWEIDEQTITLRFGKPEMAGKYLERLFEFAFAIRRDGLIWLPGQFETEPAAAVLADLQSGLTLTFLQHGKVRQLAKELSTKNYDVEGEGAPAISVEYRACSGFKHQDGWKDFVDKNGVLVRGSLRVDGPISPGTVVRHVAFTGDTAAEDPPERMLPLCFAIVGCLALPVNRGVAALLVPEVESLIDFQYDRPAITPKTATQCQIANAADGALQAQLRLRNNPARQAHVASKARQLVGNGLPGCYAMTFTPTAWASQQKSRVATIHVPRGEATALDRFDRALSYLPPRIVARTVKEASGRGKKKRVIERAEAFRSDSVVRPLIAENLALGRKWYAGFVRLMTRTNPATGKAYRHQLSFERKGLNDMISDQKMWDQEGEALFVRAVHEAIRQALGRIRDETDRNSKVLSQATKNRWDRFREKLRLDLAGSKTAAQLRFALADLFSRGGSNAVLRESWTKVLPTIRSDWQLSRDLGLLALASYASKAAADVETGSAAPGK
jgi:CRISPR-associated protein Cas8a1/Csx13